MRFLDWDCLLFPLGDSAPTQEFRQDCEYIPRVDDELAATSSQDVDDLSSVSSYISMLPAGKAFQMSIHSWKPPVIENPAGEERPMFEYRLFIDGEPITYVLLSPGGSLPLLIESYPVEGQPMQKLKFPDFDPESPVNDNEGSVGSGSEGNSIGLVISEGYLTPNPDDPNKFFYIRVKDIVSFTFYYAPSDILEEYGILYPRTRRPAASPARSILPEDIVVENTYQSPEDADAGDDDSGSVLSEPVASSQAPTNHEPGAPSQADSDPELLPSSQPDLRSELLAAAHAEGLFWFGPQPPSRVQGPPPTINLDKDSYEVFEDEDDKQALIEEYTIRVRAPTYAKIPGSTVSGNAGHPLPQSKKANKSSTSRSKKNRVPSTQSEAGSERDQKEEMRVVSATSSVGTSTLATLSLHDDASRYSDKENAEAGEPVKETKGAAKKPSKSLKRQNPGDTEERVRAAKVPKGSQPMSKKKDSTPKISRKKPTRISPRTRAGKSNGQMDSGGLTNARFA